MWRRAFTGVGSQRYGRVSVAFGVNRTSWLPGIFCLDVDALAFTRWARSSMVFICLMRYNASVYVSILVGLSKGDVDIRHVACSFLCLCLLFLLQLFCISSCQSMRCIAVVFKKRSSTLEVHFAAVCEESCSTNQFVFCACFVWAMAVCFDLPFVVILHHGSNWSRLTTVLVN